MDTFPFRIVFAGNPEIAVPTLLELNKHFEVVAVLTHPDKPGKRGHELIPVPVKKAALENSITVIEADRLNKEIRQQVASYSPNLLISFATSHYFGPKFLQLFSIDALNIHPSLLPLHRGSAPLHYAILNQDRETGISIQRIVKEIDSGNILNSISFPLTGEEHSEDLASKVAPLAASLIVNTLQGYDSYREKEVVQKEEEATFTQLLSKEDGIIDFASSAASIHAKIRAYYPWPKASTTFNGEMLILAGVSLPIGEVGKEVNNEVPPGTVVSFDKKKGLKIACSDAFIYASRVQIAKKKEMDASSFVNGNPHIIGSKLGV
ncbi:MAG: methionyl-tRNA formyltransferase [Spirochaetia bacterium]|nr:methionyl-tRNA formyltransferase [Spirochaetia bacterium]